MLHVNVKIMMTTLLVAMSLFSCTGVDSGQPTATKRVRRLLKRLNKPAVVSIQSPDGDIIDCVHVYHQPAFDHPLLKNHTLKLHPSSYPIGLSVENNRTIPPIAQLWRQNGSCPKDTIPIKRTKAEDILRAASVEMYGRKTYTGFSRHEHAVTYVPDGAYYGTKATINVWQPEVHNSPDEFSLSQLWILAGKYGSDLNSVEAGWHVFPHLHGDHNTRLFIYWTRDWYQSTGCYNLLCSGFVQTNNDVVLGGTIHHISQYDSHQYAIKLLIWRDSDDGDWWFKYDDSVLGYWPSSLFTHLSHRASVIQWGGEVLNTKPNGVHTTTEMGSGHFPDQGFGKASYFKNIEIVDSSHYMVAPRHMRTNIEKPACYNLRHGHHEDWGHFFYYGGPGRNAHCP